MIYLDLLFAALVIAGAVVFCVAHERQHEHDRVRWQEERQQLLDRLMARDYGEYWAGQSKPAPKLPKQLYTDEDIAAYLAEHHQDRAGVYGG